MIYQPDRSWSLQNVTNTNNNEFIFNSVVQVAQFPNITMERVFYNEKGIENGN